jgi:lipopolysaccharide export system protein LptC
MATPNPPKAGFFDKITEIRKWVMLLLVALVLFFGYKYFTSNNSNSTVEYDTNLIQQQIKNVGKLVVTEGHFAEVLTYKDSRETYIPGLSFDKKALVVINADVTVGFDLSKVKYDIDEKNKVLTITNIPAAEIKIAPDFKYYDTQSSTFNEFTGSDYNKINKIARANLEKKINASTLKNNAKNRLVTELSKILILTNSMGWTIEYKGQKVTSEKQFSL